MKNNLIETSRPFLDFLENWVDRLPVSSWEQILSDPRRTAIVSVDVIEGFCYEGPLSSPRVAQIVSPIRTLFEQAWQRGVRDILLTQDSHEPQAVEFASWPPHCVRGTQEAQTVAAFQQLPFFGEIPVIEKNSISSGLNTGLNDWLEEHPAVGTFIVVGDCTDLCTYQLAMHLRLDANSRQLQRRVIVPANCVDTYDMDVATAKSVGALPHSGDLIHAFFLYHMALNGVEVVSAIE